MLKLILSLLITTTVSLVHGQHEENVRNHFNNQAIQKKIAAKETFSHEILQVIESANKLMAPNKVVSDLSGQSLNYHSSK